MKAVSIKKTLCPKPPTPPKASAPVTLAPVIAAFNSGLGIRKKHWGNGYFVYLEAGVIKDGNIGKPCREDKNKSKEFTFGPDASVWEIVDAAYIAAFKANALTQELRAVIASNVAAISPAQVSAVAKLLKLKVAAPIPCA